MDNRPLGGLTPSLRDAPTQPLYNTAAVVRLSDVPAATFRAWERRYGFPSPKRLPAGQRLYSDRDIAAIRWLHEQTGRGLTISRAISMLQHALTEIERPSPGEVAGRPTSRLATEILAALTTSDQNKAEAVLSEALALYSIETVALEVVEPVLVEIGERWHTGQLSVSQEHYSTQFLIRKLFALINTYDVPRGQKLVITACGPGEWHEVGVLIVSLFLVRRGHRVLYLGPNLPLSQVQTQTLKLKPDLVCFSATMEDTARALIRESRTLSETSDGLPRLGFGGQAFEQNRAFLDSVPGCYLGRDAREATSTIERVLGSDETV
jgi:methanogenic corrinoid protein MtbC1